MATRRLRRFVASARRLGREDRGGAEVELAILGPLLLIVIFGAIQVTTYFTARTVALSAAQVGVDAERRYDAQPGVGREQAQAFLAQAGEWLINPRVGNPVRTADEVSMTVQGEAPSILFTWEIEQTAHGTVERFTELP
jgi:Flp pilus assembly protein TadG